MHQPVEFQERGAPAGSNASQDQRNGLDHSASAMQSIEALVNSAAASVRANPGLAIAGVGAVVIIALLAAKSRTQPTTRAKVEKEVRKFLAEHSEKGSDLADSMSDMVSKVMTMDASTIAAYRDIAETWLSSGKRKAEAAIEAAKSA